MRRTLYLPPHKNWALFSTVSGVTADTDTQLPYLTDGRPNGFPLRVASGTGTIQLSKAAGLVNLVALTHHRLDPALVVTLGGDVTGAITIPADDASGMPFHAFTEVTETSVDTLTFAIASNSTDILIGEAFAGEALPLGRDDITDPNSSFLLDDLEFRIDRYRNDWPALSGIPAYSERAEGLPIDGSVFADATQLAAMLDWYRSEDAYPYPVPSLLIPNADDPTSARVVRFAAPPTWSEVEVAGPDPFYRVRLSFLEYPRTRW